MKVHGIKQRISIACLFIVSAIFWMIGGLAIAQTTTGSIYGTVTDATGAVIPGAQVIVKNIQTGEMHTMPSSSSGDYVFSALVPGDYTVSAQNTGFQTQIQKGIRLDSNQNVHANFSLQPGSTGQSVTVSAATALVDTRESQIGETVDQKRMEDLPLNGRDAYNLVQIVPGITSYSPDVATGSREGEQFSVNGLPISNTAFYLDGAYDTNLWRFGGNLLPNPDALQEFRILTSNFDAEFGRSPGGVVNVITRSGTNQFHGELYDYLRNDILNAKDYFLTAVPPLKQNQFGGTVGGPIRRDKIFFFLAYQGLRVRQPADIASDSLVTPTPLEAIGDFRNTPANIRPNVSCNGVKYVICPSLLDPVAQNLLKFVPSGNPTPGINYGRPAQQSSNANINADQGMARVDYQVTSKHQISGMYFMSRGTSNNPTASKNQILSYAGMENYEGQYNAVIGDTWLISPAKVNNLRLFYSLNHYIIANIYGQQHMLANLGSHAAEGGDNNAQPYFSISGYWTMGTNNAGPDNLPSSSLGASDTFNWIIGKHEIKTGGSYMWDRFGSIGGASSNGIFTFNGDENPSKNALVDFLEGHAYSLTQNNGVFFRSHSQDPSVFAQDNWQIARRLTLNLGLRWEYFPPYAGQNDTGTFVPNVQSVRFPNAPLGLLSSGDPGIPDGILHTPWDTFAPRFGFAYDVFGDGKTSVRGAYGIFDAATDQGTSSDLLVQQPFSRTITISKTPNLVTPYAPNPDPFPYPYTQNPQPAVFLSGATIYGLPPGDSTIPYVQEFNLNVQQQYGSKWSSQIAYIGNLSRHFDISDDVNSPIYSPNCTTKTCGGTANLNKRRPYQPTPSTYTFGTISIAEPVSNASYHSLQATVTRQFDHHFSFQASYVWSKAMGYGPPVDAYVISSSRGLLAVDVPQRFVASYIWVLPEIHYWGKVGEEALSDWQFNGITTFSTGQPFNVTSGSDTNFDGNNNDRPNVIGNPFLSGGRSRREKINEFFNTNAFAIPPAGTPYGNAPFDMLIGPGYVDTDVSAFKAFHIYKESNLEVRGDIFNVFNNVNLNNPNAVKRSPKFGTIGGTSAPRIVQISLRYYF